MTSTRILAAALLLAATAAHGETLTLHATLSAASEVPPTGAPGTGSVDARYDTGTHRLSYTLAWSGLTGPATMAHFHGPAAAGTNAGVVVPLGNAPASPIRGAATLTDAQAADLRAGLWYANVHTAAHPKGEIRGQLK